MIKGIPVIFILAFAAFGQGLSVDELKARAKAIKADKEVLIGYDKFKDEAAIMSKPRNLVGSWEGAMSIMGSSGLSTGRTGTPKVIMISISTSFAGKSLTETPDKFVLAFDTMSPEWMFMKGDRTIYFLYDDEQRLKLDPLVHDGDLGRRSGVREMIAYEMTRDQIEKLSAAKKVELRIGTSAKPREIKSDVLKSWKMLLDVTKL